MANGLYAGWAAGAPSFSDPRPPGRNPDDMGRGPIPATAGRWNGVRVAGDGHRLEDVDGDNFAGIATIMVGPGPVG